MFYGKLLFPLLLLVSLLFPAARAADLLEAYGWAHKNDHKYQSALLRYQSDSLASKLASASTLPQIGYSYRWKKNEYESDTKSLSYTGELSLDFRNCEDWTCVRDKLFGLQYKDTHNKYTSRESALTLTQTIYDTRRYAERFKSEVAVEKATIEIEGAEQDLVVRLVEAYLDVLRAQDDKDFARQQLDSIDAQKKFAEKRYELGVGKETEVYDAQSAYDAQLTVFELSRAQHFIKLRKLSAITGVEMATVFPVSDQMPVETPLPGDADHWVGLALQRNAAIRLAETAEKMASYERFEKRYTHLPTLNFAAAYVETDLQGGQGFSPAATSKAYGLEFHLPLYQGGAVSTASKQSAFRLEEAKEQLLSQRQQVEMAVVNLLLLIKTDVKRYQATSLTVASSRKAYEVRSRAYREGGGSLPELFQAEKNHFQARKELSSVRYDYLLNLFRLYQMTGTLSPKELTFYNAWFQPPL